jgi:hypothetical protein
VPANYYHGFTVLSNPSGYVHNGCECGLDLIVADLTSSNIQSVDNSTSERDYVKRVSSELASQILQYDAGTLSPAQLTRTRRYVG